MKKILIPIILSVLVAVSSCGPKRYLTTSRAPGVALDRINIGAYNNDPGADKARTAFGKADLGIAELNRLRTYDLEEDELAILMGATITTAELNRLAGVTSAIQTQINGRIRSVDSTGNAAGNYVTRKALVDTAATKQDALISGTNIKTINSTSILGSGNIAVTAAGLLLDSVRVEREGYYGVYELGEQLAPDIPDAYTDDPYDIFPEIHAFAGDTSNYPVPDKIGNLFINTSTSKVYVSVSTSRGGWVILNLILPLFYFVRRRRHK